jgi:BirA family biotin operon repressor/biotin-[acetyl-CoA-carboxylase] ligase
MMRKETKKNMSESFIPLDSHKIARNTDLRETDILVFQTIDSTNEYLKKISHPIERPQYCLSEQQTQGKGRLNRTWYSPFGENVYFSASYPFKSKHPLSPLSLVVGLTVAQILEILYKLPIQLKWPNDLLCHHKKLGGILIETEITAVEYTSVIIGIGININMTKENLDDHQVNQPWTSIRECNGKYNDRNTLCIAIIQQLNKAIKRFQADGFTPFLSDWPQKDALYNKHIQFKTQNDWVTGRVTGITEQGQLLVILANGQEKALTSGEPMVVI